MQLVIQTENTPFIAEYLLRHNLTGDETTIPISNTSAGTKSIPLSGVPAGHYLISVAARNVIGEGEKFVAFFTGTKLYNRKTMQAC